MESIREFYSEKTIFITGASGFMGKVLLEKLLYSCSELKKIYILMREKKGKSVVQRIEELLALPLFDRIVKEKPEVFNKLIPVYGDICVTNLGLSESDLSRVLGETNIIFHMAATVNFEAPLKTAVEMNIRAVDYVMNLAKQMPKLVVMLHLSTAFCCCDQKILREEVYDWNMDPKKLIQCAEWMTEETMNVMGKTIIGPHPNTYTYTKRLAELLVRDEYPKLPILIVRPSIVLPIYDEPLPGWVDNLNGPVGVMLGAGKGVIRSMLCQGSTHAEVVPVDFAINGICIIAWQFAMMNEKPIKIPVYNVTVPEHHRYSWEYLLNEARRMCYEYPFEAGLWYPGGDITSNKILHKIRVVFTQWIPAYFIDGICALIGRKRFLVKLQKKISMGMNMLQYFSMRKWDFRSDNRSQIRENMSAEENEIFYTDLKEADVTKYMKNCILGGRQYCLKEPLTTLEKARLQLKFLRVLDGFTKLLWTIMFGWFAKLLVSKFLPQF